MLNYSSARCMMTLEGLEFSSEDREQLKDTRIYAKESNRRNDKSSKVNQPIPWRRAVDIHVLIT